MWNSTHLEGWHRILSLKPAWVIYGETLFQRAQKKKEYVLKMITPRIKVGFPSQLTPEKMPSEIHVAVGLQPQKEF